MTKINRTVLDKTVPTINSFTLGGWVRERSDAFNDGTGTWIYLGSDLPYKVEAGTVPTEPTWKLVIPSNSNYKVVPSIEALKSTSVSVGDVVEVLGYYSSSDGAGHRRIVSTESDGSGVLLDSGLYANVLVSGDVCVDWFGAVGDGVVDDHPAIQQCINTALSTDYQGSWESTSRRNPRFNVYMSRKTYRITKQILLPPYMKFYGLGSRWYFSGVNHTKLVPDFKDPLQFAVKTANYIVETGTLAPEGVYSGVLWLDTKKLTACNGVETWGYSIEPPTQILGGVRIIGAPTSKVYDVFIDNIDIGIRLDCSWCSYIDCRTEHFKTGVCTSSDGNSTHVDGYYTGNKTKKPLTGNIYLDPIECTDPTTGLSNQAISKPNTVIGVVVYFSQGTTSTRLTCEGNDYSVAVARGGLSVDLLYSERTAVSSVVGYNSQVSIGEITGAVDTSTFCMGVSNTWSLARDTQTGTTKRFQYVSEYGNTVFVPSNFKEYTRGVHVQGHDFSTVYADAVNGSDTSTGTINNPVKSMSRALELVSTVYPRSNRIPIKNTGAKNIILKSAGTYKCAYGGEVQGGSLCISGDSNSTVLVEAPIRLRGTQCMVQGINFNRAGTDFGQYHQGAFHYLGGTVSISFNSCYVDVPRNDLVSVFKGSAGTLCITFSGSTVTATSNSAIVRGSEGGTDSTGTSVYSIGTEFTGGIETRDDKGLAIPSSKVEHTQGI